ncbi:Hypothetical predicted protein [Octopus vulgaris]|uniref:Uncharacterized protein n=1 Tax=Octopus vulgaris TaxID=6645 RepID=A0AA36F075_OCTVU|nr:Hypothetical predicted protein [Octopus vulgaris]
MERWLWKGDYGKVTMEMWLWIGDYGKVIMERILLFSRLRTENLQLLIKQQSKRFIVAIRPCEINRHKLNFYLYLVHFIHH